MSWAKLDDHFPTHPKVVKAGGDAGWLHVCALCYCAEHLTDGVFPKELVPRLSDRKNPTALAERLQAVGMWIDLGTEWELHDYLEWNPSRAHVLAEREAARERRARQGQRGGRASGDVRANETSPVPVPDSPNGELGAVAPTKTKRKKAAHPLPDGWTPSAATREWAKAEYPEHATKAVLGAFCDHARANDRRQVDWDTSFRNWIRNEAKWAKKPAGREPSRTYL